MVIRKIGILNVQIVKPNFATRKHHHPELSTRKFIIFNFQLLKSNWQRKVKLLKFQLINHNLQLVKSFP